MEIRIAPSVELSSVLVALETLGLGATVRREDPAGGDAGQKSELLIDSADTPQTLRFVDVILRKLGESVPDSDLYADLSVSDKAQVDSWLAWCTNELGGEACTSDGVASAIRQLQGHLTSRQCMVGSKATLADIHTICELVTAVVNANEQKVEEMPLKAEWVLGQWISRVKSSVPALDVALNSYLDTLRNRVTELKKAKQPFQTDLLRMQKMKAIVGADAAPAASTSSKKQSVSAPSGHGLPPVEEQPAEEAKEVDEEKEARKAAKKAAKEAEKAAKAARKAAEEERKKGKRGEPVPEYRLSPDFETAAGPYGNIFIQSDCRTGRSWRQLGNLSSEVGKDVWIRCRVHSSRIQGKRAFVILRQGLHLMQAMVDPETIDAAFPGADNGKKVVAFAKDVTNESVVDICAEVTVPPAPIQSELLTVKEHELLVKRVYAISRAKAELPFTLADASKKLEKNGAGGVHLETRLNCRVLDLRTRANQAIFRIQSGVCRFFRDFLLNESFTEIHTPKILAGGSEGGAEVFRLDYFPKYNIPNAYLAQSPQLYKQMALMSDHRGVFEIGPVFRSEDSFTHRHMTEFVGLDMEMHFVEDYHEVLDVLDRCFRYIFNNLNEKCAEEIESVREQFPFANMLYNKDSPCKIFTFKEAIDLLRAEGPAIATEQINAAERDAKEALERGDEEMHARHWDKAEKAMEHRAGIPEHPYLDDISTKDEKILGEVIKRKYGTEFYIIDKFPAVVRPFYTMPDPVNPDWSNSYDIFMRGEEIMSGAQRIHDPELLVDLARQKDMVPDEYYTESFSMGAFPHAGGGVGLERVVMLFLGLDNIRRTSMFPRDPKRVAP
ncbi:unnamed protein product [Amoebophrya sp. A25]|nr:unnamed protein product [Amoebophrya sp. A25]|eukprot:GSA25T00002198001.1